MKKPNGYLTTGEFARICGVNKQTLFHYDQIGILCPEIMGDNGYRYYSYLQLDTYNTIAMLKELDMPLSEIREFLNSRTPEAFLELLQSHLALVEDKILELQWLKKFITGRINITKEGIDARHNKIFMETRPAEHYIITEYSGSNNDGDIYAAIAEHISYCKSTNIYSPYAIGGFIKTSDGPWVDTYEYSHFYTKIMPEDVSSVKGAFTFEPRTYITTYSTEGFNAIPEMMNQLLHFAAKHNFRTGPYFFEDMLLDEMSTFGFDNYTLKLSIPVISD